MWSTWFCTQLYPGHLSVRVGVQLVVQWGVCRKNLKLCLWMQVLLLRFISRCDIPGWSLYTWLCWTGSARSAEPRSCWPTTSSLVSMMANQRKATVYAFLRSCARVTRTDTATSMWQMTTPILKCWSTWQNQNWRACKWDFFLLFVLFELCCSCLNSFSPLLLLK